MTRSYRGGEWQLTHRQQFSFKANRFFGFLVEEFGQAMDIDQLLRVGFGELDHMILPRLLPAGRSERIAFSSSTAVRVSAQVPICLETEVINSFRGRTRSEYKPKKAVKRSGAPAEAQPPNYFANRNNEHVLDLLVRRRDISRTSLPLFHDRFGTKCYWVSCFRPSSKCAS